MSVILNGGSGGGGGSSLTIGTTPISGGTSGYALTVGGSNELEEALIRTLLQADATRYIAITGNDSNDGLTPSTAWATAQHFADEISSGIDTGDFTITGSLGLGTFAGFGGKPIVGGGIIRLVGAGPGSTFVDAGPGDGVYNNGESMSFYVATGAAWYIDETTIQNLVNGDTLIIVLNAQNSINFGPTNNSGGNVDLIVSDGEPGIQVTAAATFQDQLSNVTVSGGGNSGIPFFSSVFIAEQSAVIFINGSYTFSGSPTFNAIFTADLAGNIQIDFASFSGAVTASQANLIWGGILQVISSGPPSLPGSGMQSDGSGIFAYLDVNTGISYGGPVALTLTVSQLPPAAFTQRGNFLVTDSTLPAVGNFGNLVIGGGLGNGNVPVYPDGTNWRIG